MSLQFEEPEKKRLTANRVCGVILALLAVSVGGHFIIQAFTAGSKPRVQKPPTEVVTQVDGDEDQYKWIYTSPLVGRANKRVLRQDLLENESLIKFVDSDTGFEVRIPEFCTECVLVSETIEGIPGWPTGVYPPRVFSLKDGAFTLAQIVEVSSDYVELFSQSQYRLNNLLEITPMYSYYLVSGKDLPGQTLSEDAWGIKDFGYNDWATLLQCMYSTFYIPEMDLSYVQQEWELEQQSGPSGLDHVTGGADSPGNNEVDSVADSVADSDTTNTGGVTSDRASPTSSGSSAESGGSNESAELPFYSRHE